jgi:hypothetical protein
MLPESACIVQYQPVTLPYVFGFILQLYYWYFTSPWNQTDM